MRHLLPLLLSLVILSSCDEECRGFKIGKEFTIMPNETLENCPKNVAVTLLDIEDSRCPEDLICIWAGMIVIEAKVRIDGEDFRFKLSDHRNASGFPEQFSTPKYTVKLIDVVPHSDSSGPDPTDQRAILLISKRSA